MDEHADVALISSRQEQLDPWIDETRVEEPVAHRVFVFEKFKRWWWLLLERCEYCGGKLEEWDYKKATCVRCGKKN